ncbi:uncharacterized protein DEA37_0009097 [Paragonimus westermani]|uniref:GIY-YIG domain-containing protein n=1 Tax=Paragonimus westermani TaxID=34504 RepID=A0A5J4P1R0_9TREM|nr:uncharacterized protein DEA37_0009097 [Paragonimus westermani]
MRRYSSANYSTDLINMSVSDVERERSEERPKTPISGSPGSLKFPRPSWFGRTVSQVSLTNRQDKSKQEIPPGKSKYKEGFGGNQTAKGFSSFVLRPFVRKACTPGPGPVKGSSPVPTAIVINDRCLSLMQLENRSVDSNPSDNESKERLGRFPKRPLPLNNGSMNWDGDESKIVTGNGYNLNRLKEILPVHATSFCVYRFVCSCGTSYTGRTTRRLSEPMREHHPAWLARGSIKVCSLAVANHLAESNHLINPADSFKPIYQVGGAQSKWIKGHLLAIAEAIAICLNSPSLCSQKRLVKTLNLPWLSIDSPDRCSENV